MQVAIPRGGTWLLVWVGMGFVLALVWQGRKRPDASQAAVREAERGQLKLLGTRWHWGSETQAFTGFLVDRYPGGAIQSRSAVAAGRFNGLSEGWHTNGVLQIQERFVAGKSEGTRVKWHANGVKASEAEIVGGKLRGTFRRWREDGTLMEEVEMWDDAPRGLTRLYYEDGSVRSEIWVEEGKVRERKNWKAGDRVKR